MAAGSGGWFFGAVVFVVVMAALMAIRVAEDVHVALVDGHAPKPNPIPPAQRLLQARAAEARRLAWDLLRTGLED